MSPVVALFDRQRFEKTHRTGGRGTQPRQTEIAKEIAGEIRARSVETAWIAADSNIDPLPSKQTINAKTGKHSNGGTTRLELADRSRTAGATNAQKRDRHLNVSETSQSAVPYGDQIA